MSFAQTEISVIQWAEKRRIIPNATPASQIMKLVSEVGELCDAEGKKNDLEAKDAVGDIVVCLVNYCALKDYDLSECFAGAYEQIKNRTGTLMPDGTFVKEQS